MSRTNFVQVQLAAAANSTQTTLSVSAPDGGFVLPPTTGGFLVLTDSPGRPTAFEVVSYTSRSGTGPFSLSGVTRGLEGTIARSWTVGTFVMMSLTAGELDGLLGGRAPLTGEGTSGTWPISVAGSAASLTTARTINGTSFNGSANITTTNWGTARTVTIGDTGKSVNGSANVSWSLNEIGAAASSHTHTLAEISDSGNLAALSTNGSTANYLRGDGTWVTPPNTTYAEITTAEIDAGTASTLRTITGRRMKYAMDTRAPLNHTHDAAELTSGIVPDARLSGTYTAASIGGNAATATALQTARTINGVSFDGTANITVADATKLPLAGGTMTGAIGFAAGQTWPTFNQNTTGNAATATALQTGRTIGMTGDVSWTSASFNGTGNVTGTATLANSGVTAGTYTKVTVDAKGRVTAGAALASSDLPTYTGTLTLAQVTGGLGFTPYNATNPDGYITASASITGNAATASALQTARTIGGVSFDGTANINLPGVNAAGNQNTTGNAATATVLQTARTINGTSFNGSANITTTNWGTARTLTIGATGKSVNGSGNVGWTLAEIGAAAASHTHAAEDVTSGVFATARLGTGTADSTTYLRGDGTWAVVQAGSTYTAGNGIVVDGTEIRLNTTIAGGPYTFSGNVTASNSVPLEAIPTAWVAWQGSPATIRASYGPIAGVTRVTTGTWDITFSQPLSSANLSVAGWARGVTTTAPAIVSQNSGQTVSNTTIRIETRNTGATLVDSTYVSLLIFGG